MSKKLQSDSKYSMADSDGDGIVTDEEMDRHEIKKGFDGSCPTYRKKGERFLNSAKININNAAMGKFPVPLLEK